jgi:hypothetical protein
MDWAHGKRWTINRDKMKIKELRALPHRQWDEVKTYESIIVISSGKKHDSGWALMYVIGCDGGKKEIAAACDDICWDVTAITKTGQLRNDMYYPSGAIHYWGNGLKFKVGCSLSSTYITITTRT